MLNYLAHLHLAGDDPEAILGNLMGDFVRGPVPEHLAETVRAGVRLHRRIDRFADQHPLFKRSRARINPSFRRYAGIAVDLIYDHCLARAWPRYHDQRLEAFAQRVYRILADAQPLMPTPMRARVDWMIRNDLLVAYREEATLEPALAGIAGRLRRSVRLEVTVADYRRDRKGFGEDFEAFYPLMCAYAEAESRRLLAS